MPYVVSGLSLGPFAPLFGLPDDELSAHAAVRVTAGEAGYHPCRVTLADARPGDRLLLVNFEHQAARSPYRSRHAIFVNEAARETARYVDCLPPVIASRPLIALRAFDDDGMMVGAELAPGPAVEAAALRLLDDAAVAYLHAHYPARGCYAARIDRV